MLSLGVFVLIHIYTYTDVSMYVCIDIFEYKCAHIDMFVDMIRMIRLSQKVSYTLPSINESLCFISMYVGNETRPRDICMTHTPIFSSDGRSVALLCTMHNYP